MPVFLVHRILSTLQNPITVRTTEIFSIASDTEILSMPTIEKDEYRQEIHQVTAKIYFLNLNHWYFLASPDCIPQNPNALIRYMEKQDRIDNHQYLLCGISGN